MKIKLPFRHALAAFLACILAACASRQTAANRPPAMRAPEGLRVLERAERPGLATGWGEQRESWVAPTFFARAWGDRPSAVDKLFYNDREGVDAMLAYLGGEPRSVPGLQRAAGGLVRMGVRNGSGQYGCAAAQHRPAAAARRSPSGGHCCCVRRIHIPP
jgi:hypothetical protein